MSNNTNVYCDESCHLEKDESNTMVIGAIFCPENLVSEISSEIKKLKAMYGFSSDYELKWTKIRKVNKSLAIDLVNYFFSEDQLLFRAIIIDKTDLNHEKYNQDHHTWYYKMFYRTLTYILKKDTMFNIYIDIKDSKSNLRNLELQKILSLHAKKFDNCKINKVQSVRSHESQIIQLSDILIGSLRYYNEGLKTSQSKTEIISSIKERYRYPLDCSSPLNFRKFNIFYWTGYVSDD